MIRNWNFVYLVKLLPNSQQWITTSFQRCFLIKQAKSLQCSFCHNPFQRVMTFHSSSILFKKKKEEKPKNVIQFRPKSKQPVVQLWRGVTLFEIAGVMQRNIDDILEAVSYIENNELYEDPECEIYEVGVISAIVKRLGHRVEMITSPDKVKQKKAEDKDIVKSPLPHPSELVKRPPVVAIMGHVDHGKTTLLDSLRDSSIVSQEFGGITQHIGAFTVKLPQGQITFLDTPGHAAFRTMRARGAHATDLVILVVAADDGIMEQTVESVRFAKEADVPIIVAINKIDKPICDIHAVKQGLLACGLQVEDLGGDIQAIPVSALKKTNLDLLTEAILTQAEVMGIGGDPKGPVEGVVLESSLDTVRGKVSTALIERGTLKKGVVLVAGTAWAKVRHMYDEHGKSLTQVTPGMAVQVVGWKVFPAAGEVILEAKSDRHAREVVSWRESKNMDEKMMADQIVIQRKLDEHRQKYQAERMMRLMRGRYMKRRGLIREKESFIDNSPCLSFVLKGDVHGSVEAILDAVDSYESHDACRLDVIHSGVGNVTENDVMLAETFDGIIYTFNVSVPSDIKTLADEKGIVIKPFNVIYHLIDDMKVELSDRLPLVEEEEVIGEAIVLQEFSIKEKRKKIPVAGCKCTKGLLKKNSLCKVIRSEKVLYKGPIASLRHEKSDVESVKKDVECGVMVEDNEISFLPGDVIICYNSKNVSQVTDWNPGF